MKLSEFVTLSKKIVISILIILIPVIILTVCMQLIEQWLSK
jgi:hypothetical protein